MRFLEKSFFVKEEAMNEFLNLKSIKNAHAKRFVPLASLLGCFSISLQLPETLLPGLRARSQ